MMIKSLPRPVENGVASALKACKIYFVYALLFSCAINVLYLAPSIYMLQVYDRVLTSASKTTLVMLTLALAIALAAMAVLDAVRGHVLSRAGARLDRLLSVAVMTASMDALEADGPRSQSLRDLDTFRQFVTGTQIHAAFDLPWTPIYLIAMFLIHPALGVFAILVGGLLLALAVINEVKVNEKLTTANVAAARSYAFSEKGFRNSEVIRALGMMGSVLAHWGRDRSTMVTAQREANDAANVLQSAIKFTRLFAQSLALGLGAWLVMERQMSPGGIIAGTILLGRALQPIEQVVGAWRGFITARLGYARLERLLEQHRPLGERLALPKPAGHVVLEGVGYAAPRQRKPILHGISLRMSAGEVIGVIGPSGAGKSTLARVLIGLLAPSVGAVRLDGADVSRWPREQLGPHLGYLPQDVDLFDDTVAANIARLGPAEPEQVIAAARLAGVHEAILRLPDGYDTQLGEGGVVLSGGLRQRIGLARAVFGTPALVVLDEPSSNLDGEGDFALAECILGLKQARTTVLVISHRPQTVGMADKILVLHEGTVDTYGPRAEVLARLTRPARSGGSPQIAAASGGRPR